MTGFGSASGELSDSRSATVRISSLNGRFLEVSLKVVPRMEVEDLEPEVRRLLAARLQRGRVQVAVEVHSIGAKALGVELRWDVAEALVVELARRPAGLDLAPLSLRDLLALPGFADSAASAALGEAERQALLELVGEACAGLVAAREREGRELTAHLEEAVAEIEGFTTWLREIGGELQVVLLTRLRQRLASLLDGVEVPEDRLLAEAAVLAERSDVAEETQRLAAHVEHFRELLGTAGAVGKKLDFLAQEMLREVNTAASKCREAGMGERVVGAKAALERLREQLANIE